MPEVRRGPMRFGAIRRRAARLMRELDISPPVEVGELCDRLGRARGRPIRLIEHTFSETTTFGLWIGTVSEDLVIVEQETTPAHQRHIVLHEIGHIVFEHGTEFGLDGLAQDLTPTLDPELVRGALRRSAYDSASEHDAEQFASIITGWIGEYTTLPTGPAPSSDALAQAYDYRWEWR